MKNLTPAKREQLVSWLKEFSSDFAQAPAGKKHAAQYDVGREEGRRYLSEAQKLLADGKDPTVFVLDHLLPHSNTQSIRARGAWIHIAPAVSKNIRTWFEGAKWARKEDWPEIAKLILEFFSSSKSEPDRIEEWCKRFEDSPLSKGFRAGILSPMLNAILPDRFAIINKKPLSLLVWCFDREFDSSLNQYPENSKLLFELAEELGPDLDESVENKMRRPDALDMFSHWLITTKRLGSVAKEADQLDEDGNLITADESEDASRTWIIAAGKKGEAWQLFQDESCIAMDWTGIKDLRRYATREAIAQDMRKVYKASSKDPRNNSLACWQFSREIRLGDLVVAKEGRGKLFGVGRVVGGYEHEAAAKSYTHRISVDWIKTGSWRLKSNGLPIKTLTEVTTASFLKELEEAFGGFGGSDRSSNARQFWWVNFNPANYDMDAVENGHKELYPTHENGIAHRLIAAFDNARPGDLVVAYATAPRTRVSVLCRVAKGVHESEEGRAITIERIRALRNTVSLDEIRKNKLLKNLRFLQNPNGTLFPLSPTEFEVLMKMAGEGEVTDAAEVTPYTSKDALAELFMSAETLDEAIEQLRRKQNIVLQGPPGVGKTYAAKRIAYVLLGCEDPSRVEMVQFHPSTSYEDFVMGFRPDSTGFSLKPGVFHRFCVSAQRDPDRKYVFIIDEINRGNLPKILGELMMLIEPDKRGAKFGVSLAYHSEKDPKFYLPKNLFIIGTMNTADRSLALVDYALRRRFAFITLDPIFGPRFQETLVRQGCADAIVKKICARIASLNEEICKDTRSLGRGYQVGHSFFCTEDRIVDAEKWFDEVVKFEIRPLLEEYWMDDPKKVEAEVKKLLD